MMDRKNTMLLFFIGGMLKGLWTCFRNTPVVRQDTGGVSSWQKQYPVSPGVRQSGFVKHAGLLRVLGVFLFVCTILFPCYVQSIADTGQPAEQVAAWLKEADDYVEQGELSAGYDVYLRILALEPANEHARTKIFEILHEYKVTLSDAREQNDEQRTELYAQRYRIGVRDLLQLLTTRLKSGIERYGELVTALKSGEDVLQDIPPVLTTVIQILLDLTTIYADFPQNEEEVAGAQKIVERLKHTVTKYEQELELYQQQSE